MASDDARFLQALRARQAAGTKLRFLYFWGHRTSGKLGPACFSQWYPAPFVLDGERYATAEHFMMAQKAALFGDEATRHRVMAASSPAAAKACGRGVRGFEEARWAAHRFDIVVRGNRAKFTQNPDLHAFLQSSAPYVLVEASPVDRIWGIGLAQDDPQARDPNRWRGLNLLGFALMAVRDASQ